MRWQYIIIAVVFLQSCGGFEIRKDEDNIGQQDGVMNRKIDLSLDTGKYESFLVYSCDDSSLVRMLKDFRNALDRKEKMPFVFKKADSLKLVELPKSLTIGEIAFLTSWLDQVSIVVLKEKNSTVGNIYFCQSSFLAKDDFLLAQLSDGRSFKVYIPNVSWDNFNNTTYAVGIKMNDKMIRAANEVINNIGLPKLKGDTLNL